MGQHREFSSRRGSKMSRLKDEQLLDHEIYNINDIHEPTFRKKAQEVFDRLDKLLEESDDELAN
jgi:hypothetical protein